ncbi:MAG: Peptidase family protein [Dehalococcoidia bacterium]|nr:Peptidase family protein [Dehalococcoidia bacterium]
MPNAITDVPGIQVGHFTDRKAGTGCTVILCPQGAVGGVDVRGSAPGTRETDLLRPGNLVQQVHGVLLSGGSAFGLDAASGVMRYLEERGIGFSIGPAVVPIVPAAIIFDLGLVSHLVRPGPEEGYTACRNATEGPLEEGSVGAGTGATVGKVLGRARATKGGLGTSSISLGDITVGALAVVNAMGDVVDPDTGRLLAGPRNQEAPGFLSTVEILTRTGEKVEAETGPANTTLAVVATDALLNKEQANKLAQVGHDGLALAVRPCHSMGDGDVIFALAMGKSKGEVDMRRLCAAATLAVARAVVRGVLMAEGLGGVPSAREVTR